MVFIIVPIYNTSQYLKRCLDSIISNAIEKRIICVNDGSTDNSLEILKEYGSLIEIINKSNGGLSSARNAGLDYINSISSDDDVVFFIDSDDWVDSNYFEVLLKTMVDYNADIVSSSLLFSTDEKEKKYHQIEHDELLNSKEATIKLLYDTTIQSHAHCKAYRKWLWNSVRFPEDIPFMEDQATTFKVFDLAKRIFLFDYHGYHYWQSGTSLLRGSISNKKILYSLKGYLESYNYYKNNPDSEYLFASIQGFAANYLMMYPRINFKDKNNELVEIKKIIKFVKENRIIKQYKPTAKREINKKRFYLFSKKFYCLIYKICKKI